MYNRILEKTAVQDKMTNKGLSGTIVRSSFITLSSQNDRVFLEKEMNDKKEMISVDVFELSSIQVKFLQ